MKNSSYRNAREKLKTLSVVEDCSEKAVKLTENYANNLTKDENQKLYLLQCIDEFKKDFQNPNKKSIVIRFKESDWFFETLLKFIALFLYLKRIILGMDGK